MYNMPMQFRYAESYKNFPKTCQDGDVVIETSTGTPYVWIDKEYIRLDGGDEEQNTPSYPQICSRCGAPMVGHRCEYCGTEYL